MRVDEGSGLPDDVVDAATFHQALQNGEVSADDYSDASSGWSFINSQEALDAVTWERIGSKLEPVTAAVTQGLSKIAEKVSNLNKETLSRLSSQDKTISTLSGRLKYTVIFGVVAVGAMLTGAVHIITSSVHSASERVINTISGSWQNTKTIAPADSYKKLEYSGHPKELTMVDENTSQKLSERDYEKKRQQARAIKA
jgi:hypothetical protein